MLSRIVLFSGAALAVAAAVVAAGCGGSSGGKENEIVAAFYPLAFAAEQIAGPAAEVRNLTPAGAEPHDLELTPSDVRAVHDASLVLYLGDGFMPGLETAVAQRPGGRQSVDVLDELRRRPGYGGGAAVDPHVWLDPVRYAEMVRLIGDALGKEASADLLARKLDELGGEYRRGLAHCARRQIVTSHAAFGYLAARYGLEQVPLEGITPEAEPSARDIARLVDVVRSSGATTVFSETLLSPKLAETIAREAGVKTAVLDPLEGISESEIAAGADYFSVMRTNLATLQEALGCTS